MSKLDHLVISLLWLLWLLFWVATSFRTKATARRAPGASRWAYLVPLLVGGVLLGTPHIAGRLLDHQFLPHTFVSNWSAILLVAIGLGFAIVARVWLGTNWSASVVVKQDHELIQNGPYRLVRHPIYTGVLLAILGTAVAIGEWRCLIALALIAFGFVTKLGSEERVMTEQFGDAYRRYQAEVPALIPFWPRSAPAA